VNGFQGIRDRQRDAERVRTVLPCPVELHHDRLARRRAVEDEPDVLHREIDTPSTIVEEVPHDPGLQIPTISAPDPIRKSACDVRVAVRQSIRES
jgi:hypothetical protein